MPSNESLNRTFLERARIILYRLEDGVLVGLLLLMIGIMEVGIAFYDYLTIERATLEGVRTASFTGTSLDADCQTVTVIVDELPGGFLDRVQQIEVYHADADGNQILAETNTWQYLGSTPSISAHFKNVSGCGFPFVTSSQLTTA